MKFWRNYKKYTIDSGARTIYVVRPKLKVLLGASLCALLIATFYNSQEIYQEGGTRPTVKTSSKMKNISSDRINATGLLSPLRPKTSSKKTNVTISPSTGLPEPQTTRSVITTIFWVGELAGPENGYIANKASAWDESWQDHYGGIDSDTTRNGYLPAGFIPKENPFYFALPYSDFTNGGKRKTTAGYCPNARSLTSQPYSWCKNAWIKIESHGKTVYAQWEDVGPYQEDDVDYVFGSAQPKNTAGARAGLDVSPAVRDYLGLSDVDKAKWQFVSSSSVPAGPWKQVVTSSLGELL